MLNVFEVTMGRHRERAKVVTQLILKASAYDQIEWLQGV